MTVQAIRIHDGPALAGWAGRRPAVADPRPRRDATRLLVAVALVLAVFLGMAGLGVANGPVAMPPDGPTPGLDI